jgi:hypothetical protein
MRTLNKWEKIADYVRLHMGFDSFPEFGIGS